MYKFSFKSLATQAVKAGNAAKAKMDLTIDAMVADGVTVEFFRKKDWPELSEAGRIKAESFIETLNEAIVASFTKGEQKLLDLPANAVPEDRKAMRKYLQQQIGSRRNDFRKSFIRRTEDGKTGANARTDDKTFVSERLIAVKKRIEKAEELPFDAVNAIAKLDELMSIVGVVTSIDDVI
jgi:hypothetical protein